MCSEDMYKKIFKHTSSLIVLRYKNTREVIEQIYLELFPQDKCLIVIASAGDDLSNFISNGLLFDLRDEEFVDGGYCKSFMLGITHKPSTYVQRCNQLRRHLVANCKLHVRFCGPELESLLDPAIYTQTREMVGLFNNFTHIGWNGTIHAYKRKVLSDVMLKDFCEVKSKYEMGQAKLWSIFNGFVTTRTLIYVGSAPGDAWCDLMNKFEWLDVISIDGRELSFVHKRVKHFQRMIRSANDMKHIYDLCPGRFDLLWDVRGDYQNADQYERMVSEEIKLLNEILLNLPEKCVRVCIKIRSNNIKEYELPINGKFFIPPFVLSRNKSELRYVAKRNLCSKVLPEAIDIIEAFRDRGEYMEGAGLTPEIVNMFNEFNGLGDYDLFIDSHCMRLDVENYILTKRIDSLIDINLFTVNWNSEGDMRRYFSEHFPVVCSYFTKNKLGTGEHVLNEINVLDFQKYTVVDSRVFINKVINDLFIIIPKNFLLFSNEFNTSQNYMLKRIFDDILTESLEIVYNRCKLRAAESIGKVFERMPIPGSWFSDNISVSGHAMRFVIAFFKYNNVSILSYFDKILYNIAKYDGLSRNGKRLLREHQVEWYPFKNVELHVERKSESFWHSIDEWKSGVKAGLIYINGIPADDTLFDKFCNFIDSFSDTKKLGREIFEHRRKYKLNLDIGQVICGMPSNNRPLLTMKLFATYSESNHFKMGYDLLKPASMQRPFSEGIDALQRIYKADKVVRFLYLMMAAVQHMSGRTVKQEFKSSFCIASIIHLSGTFDRNFIIRGEAMRDIALPELRKLHDNSPLIYMDDYPNLKMNILFNVAFYWLVRFNAEVRYYPALHNDWINIYCNQDPVYLLNKKSEFDFIFSTDDYFDLHEVLKIYKELISHEYADSF